MDWCLPPTHASAAELRRELTEYLTCRVTSDSDVGAAAIVISELLSNAVEHAGTKIWVNLDWCGEHPVFTVHDLGPEFQYPTVMAGANVPHGRGLMLATALALDLGTERGPCGGNIVRAVLDLVRLQPAAVPGR